MERIDKVINAEWEQFRRVENEGGRAACQYDYGEFKTMRMSQFSHWPEDALESYYEDLRDAERRGWNLLTEKYARMMEHTAPRAYEAIRERLPAVSEEKQRLVDEIAAQQLSWHRQCRARYPRLTALGRELSGVAPGWASADVYLRGELATYSKGTLRLYLRHVREAAGRGENLVERMLSETARRKGYASAWDAEERLEANIQRD